MQDRAKVRTEAVSISLENLYLDVLEYFSSKFLLGCSRVFLQRICTWMFQSISLENLYLDILGYLSRESVLGYSGVFLKRICTWMFQSFSLENLYLDVLEYLSIENQDNLTNFMEKHWSLSRPNFPNLKLGKEVERGGGSF